MDVNSDGSAACLCHKAHGRTLSLVYDFVRQCPLSITKIDGYKRWRCTSKRTVIGYSVDADILQFPDGCGQSEPLVEISFENEIVRTFPFTMTASFDFDEASDCMVVSSSIYREISVVQFTTAEILHTIPCFQLSAYVSLSSSGHFISASCGKVHVFSNPHLSGIKASKMYVEDSAQMYQFLSDETILVHSYTRERFGVTNMFTGKTCEFLPNLNFTLCTIPFVRGNYAYCLVDGKICAYE